MRILRLFVVFAMVTTACGGGEPPREADPDDELAFQPEPDGGKRDDPVEDPTIEPDAGPSEDASPAPDASLAPDAGSADLGSNAVAYTDWSQWSDCASLRRERRRKCIASGGDEVPCERCGGECYAVQRCISCEAFNLEVAATTQGDCDALFNLRIGDCRAVGGTWQGDTRCVIGGSPSAPTSWGGKGECTGQCDDPGCGHFSIEQTQTSEAACNALVIRRRIDCMVTARCNWQAPAKCQAVGNAWLAQGTCQ